MHTLSAKRLRVLLLWSSPFLLAHCLEPSPTAPDSEMDWREGDTSLPADTAVPVPPELPDTALPPGTDTAPPPGTDTAKGSGTGRSGEVLLVGRVVDHAGRPLENTVAELARLGLKDTTDAQGAFKLHIAEGPPHPQAKPGADALDSVRIHQDGRTLAVLGVPEYRDTLPDVRLFLANLTGRLSSPLADGAGLSVLLWVGQGQPLRPVPILDSGLSYRAHVLVGAGDSGSTLRCVVRALDGDGRLLGRSDTVAFLARAGAAEIPAWDPRNALPAIEAGGPASARAGDRLRLTGKALDGKEGRIVSLEWDIGNRGDFVPADADGGLVAEVPASAAEAWDCVLRATDDEGHQVLDTVSVRIDPDPLAEYRTFLGDVHSHSSFSLDYRPPDSATARACSQDPLCAGRTGADLLFHHARQAGLDFAMITDHAEDLTHEEWDLTRKAAAQHEERGGFIPFVGYEYCDSTAGREICANVIFPGTEAGKVFADRAFRRADTAGAAEYLDAIADLWERAAALPGALTFIPHPPADIAWSDLPWAPRAQGIEISSTGGSPHHAETRPCRAPVLEAFRQGLRLQVLGAGNDHEARPGRASLTGVLARELDRESIFEALLSRRTFATRGARLSMAFDIEGHAMGEAVALAPDSLGRREVTLRARVTSQRFPLQSLTFYRMKAGVTTPLQTVREEALSLGAMTTDTLGEGEEALYWVEASLQGQNPDFGSEAWTTPVWIRISPQNP